MPLARNTSIESRLVQQARFWGGPFSARMSQGTVQIPEVGKAEGRQGAIAHED